MEEHMPTPRIRMDLNGSHLDTYFKSLEILRISNSQTAKTNTSCNILQYPGELMLSVMALPCIASRMVETTKLLLQNLETALMLRAGFLANCYHRWHLEAQKARTSRTCFVSFSHRNDTEFNGKNICAVL